VSFLTVMRRNQDTAAAVVHVPHHCKQAVTGKEGHVTGQKEHAVGLSVNKLKSHARRMVHVGTGIVFVIHENHVKPG